MCVSYKTGAQLGDQAQQRSAGHGRWSKKEKSPLRQKERWESERAGGSEKSF